MINDRNSRGAAFCLLGFAAAEPLLPQLRLSLDQPDRLRALVHDAAPQCTMAAYREADDTWYVHFDALNDLVTQNLSGWLGPDDVAALERWFQRGMGHLEEDPATRFWFKVLTRLDGAGWSEDNMDKDDIAEVKGLIAGVWADWRDDTYEMLADELRDADLTAAEEDLETRFNIEFYDDVLDPLNVLHDIRKGNILHEQLDRREKTLPLSQMDRVADAWLATPAGQAFANHQKAETVTALRTDFRSIRSQAA